MGREGDLGGDSALTASRCEKKNREKVRAPSLFLTGGPEEMKGESAVEQVWRRLVASSLCKVVLSVYGAQEAAQLFNE